jgi:hypothetical protein
MKLISMTDFVLEQKSNLDFNPSNKWKDCLNYANFLNQPLKLEMIVPCDEDGNVLEEPIDEKLCKYCPIGDWKSNSIGDSCE